METQAFEYPQQQSQQYHQAPAITATTSKIARPLQVVQNIADILIFLKQKIKNGGTFFF